MLYVWFAVLPYNIGLFIGSFRNKKQQERQQNWYFSGSLPKVSLLLAFRNESLRIQPLLDSLVALDYPREKLEIIMVDDHSSDDGRKKIEAAALKNNLPVKVFSLPPEKMGKKAAIALARENATSEFLFFTDADVRLPSGWLMNMLTCQQNSGAAMVCSEVEVVYRNGFLNMFECLEQAALVAISAARVAAGKVFLCNGAGYLVKRQALEQLGLPDSWEKVPGGDDVMLLHAMHKAGEKIAYCRIPGSRVQVEPAADREFLQQRIRWGSKVFLRNTSGNLVPAVLVWVFHALYAWMIFGMIEDGYMLLSFLFYSFIVGMLFRGIGESTLIFNFLSPSFRNASLRRGRPALTPEDIARSHELKEPVNAMDVAMFAGIMASVYSLYVALAGPVLMFYRSFTWKGRDY